MKQFFLNAAEKLAEGKSLYMCEIIAAEGSTPRGNGARMAVCADMSSIGTIGGGEVEYRVVCEAARLLSEELSSGNGGDTRAPSFVKQYNLNIGGKKTEQSPDDNGGASEQLNMVCGGKNTVMFIYLAAGKKNAGIMSEIAGLFEHNTDTWLFTEIPSETNRFGELQLGVYTSRDGMYFLNGQGKTNPVTGRIEADHEEFKELSGFEELLRKTSGSAGHKIVSGGDSNYTLYAFGKSYHTDCIIKSGTVYVFGGGHVSRELIPLIGHVGFRTVLVEDREEYADISIYPGAVKAVLCPFGESVRKLGLTENDYAVIMTHGHSADYTVLRAAVGTPVKYIGLMGSRKKVKLTFERLLEDGVPESELCRIHTPIGLPIGGETPAEIAVSIAAELIKVRSGKENI